MARRVNHHASILPNERDQLPYLPPCTLPMPYVRFDTGQETPFDDTNDQSWADQTESSRGDSLRNAPSWDLSSAHTTPPNESPPPQEESRLSPQRRQDHLLGSLDVSTFESARIGAPGSYIVSEGNSFYPLMLEGQDLITENHPPYTWPGFLEPEPEQIGNYIFPFEPGQTEDIVQAHHIPEGSRKAPYYCNFPICKAQRKSFKRAADLDRHIKEQHTSEKRPFVCGNCQLKGTRKDFPRKEKLKNHLRTFHDMQEDMYEAECCKLNGVKEIHFASRSDLEHHRSHVHQEQHDVNSEDHRRPNIDSTLRSGMKHPIANAPQSKAKRGKHQESSGCTLSTTPIDSRHSVEHATINSTAGSSTPQPTSTKIPHKQQSDHKDPNPVFQNSPDDEKVPSISIATNGATEMLGLLELHGKPQNFVDRTQLRNYLGVLVALQNIDASKIWFDFTGKTISVSGSNAVNQHIKRELEEGLQEVRRFRSEAEPKANHPFTPFKQSRHHAFKPSTETVSGATNRILPVSAKEDSNVLTTWIKYILPRLSKILTPLVGDNYSAILVRHETPTGPSSPTIHIQSSCGQSREVRNEIRYQVEAICTHHGRSNIPLQFANPGRIIHLAGPSSICEPSAEAIVRDSEPNEPDLFPHHKRYWRNVGMSASGGLLGCREMTITVGGYIIVDNQTRLLTVDHFIDPSLQQSDFKSETRLTSPSLMDNVELRDDIQQNLRDIGFAIQKYGRLSYHELQNNEQFKALCDELHRFEGYERDHKRPDTGFVVGSLDKRSWRKLKDVTYNDLPLEQPEDRFVRMRHRMDWSTFKVDPSRLGRNKHRYRFCDRRRAVEFRSGETFPMGAGDLCQQCCEIESNLSVPVHYVGQSSGRVNGQISASPILVVCDGIESWEWGVVAESYRQYDIEDDYRGDSGAWILRDKDCAVVGMLWGYVQGHLVLTPIKNVFEHIKEVSERQEVCLPPPPPRHTTPGLYNDGTLMSTEATLISRPKLVGPRMPRSFKRRVTLSQLPTAQEIDAQSKASMSISALVHAEETVDQRLHSPGLEKIVEYRLSRSPTPGLSSSPASSPKLVSRSPSTPPLHPKACGFFEEREIMIRKNSDAGLTPPLEGELKLCELVPRPKKEKLEDCTKENRLSLGYILERMSLEELRPTKPITSHMDCRSQTWPSIKA